MHTTVFLGLMAVFLCPKQAQEYNRRFEAAFDHEYNHSQEGNVFARYKTWTTGIVNCHISFLFS